VDKAGRWLRASSDRQDELNQEQGIDAYIAARGYDPAKTYVAHDKSASKNEHLPLLREALADMAAGRINVLVVRNTDRIDRTESLGQILKMAEASGGRIESVTEPWLADLSGLGGKVMTGVTEWINAEYSRKLSVNVKDAQARLRLLGSYAHGEAPFGYAVAALEDGRKTLVHVEGEAEAVKMIFTLAAGGLSLRKIAKALDAAGIAAPGGKGAWPERTIGKMLQNDVYRGIVRYRGTAYMTVPGIITASDFLAANQALKARLRGPGRGGGRPSGALLKPVCGRCGAPMYKWAKRYRCAGVGPNGNSTQRKGCGNTILIEELDREVMKEFLEYDEPEILETRIPGVDHLDEIAAVQLAVRDLDVMADDYDDRHAELMAELRRLKSLPVTPAQLITRPSSQSEGEAFKAMDFEERQAFIKLWTLTVYAPGSDPRWELTREVAPEGLRRIRAVMTDLGFPSEDLPRER
jgi:DNA invertase Pin-like site-specific DNA recombinase